MEGFDVLDPRKIGALAWRCSECETLCFVKRKAYESGTTLQVHCACGKTNDVKVAEAFDTVDHLTNLNICLVLSTEENGE